MQTPSHQIPIRHDYTRAEILSVFELPFTKLIKLAQDRHQEFFKDDEIQLSTLLSIKTGGCKEDCSYCPQSAHHSGDINAHGLLDVGKIVAAAKQAKASGSTRFCMGAAWRSPPERGTQFESVLTAVSEVAKLGMEVCTTLGMLNEDQAVRLKQAGVYMYNHNLDTSPEFYPNVITTRTYQDRLDTLANVRKAGMGICCGGIVGLGESRADRVGLLEELVKMDPHPESVPINLLVRAEGTPLSENDDLDIFELVRTIATARIIMPKSRVRLSAGRAQMSDEAQALCFLAGANSIFMGEKLLTTKNPDVDHDLDLLTRLGLKPAASEAPAYNLEPANPSCNEHASLQ